MIQIEEPPDVKACAPCGSPLIWLWSPRRSGWVAFIPLSEDTLKVHGCRELQEPVTWRSLRRGTPPTPDYVEARAELKERNERSGLMSELVWKRPQRCDTGSCVAVAFDGDKVHVRDSKHPDGGCLEYTRDQWREQLEQVRADGLPMGVSLLLDSGEFEWRHSDVSLRFSGDEMATFAWAAVAGEFDLKEQTP